MIKLDVSAARVPFMTHAQYSLYAKDKHARLVIATEPVSRYIQAYIQHHVFDGAYGARIPAFAQRLGRHVGFG